MNTAELLVPALRWVQGSGFDGQRSLIDTSLELGVGGFIFFGGPAEQVRALARELSERSRHPLLIGADLERGAGQQFDGKSGLPPLAALGWLGDENVMRSAGALTAAEARDVGINWVYAPSLDIDVEPDNPIIGTRAIASDPEEVARLGSAWIGGCQSHGVLACAKHFPGHGRTTTDSHAELPSVGVDATVLQRTDLHPFRAAIAAGVASVMSAHVAYPSLDPGGGPATLSRRILSGLLRNELGFEGLIVTDALIMAGVLQGGTEGGASVRALAAGCDMLLYPSDVRAVAGEVAAALDDGTLTAAEVRQSLERRRRWTAWAADAPFVEAAVDAEWSCDVARRVVHQLTGELPRAPGSVSVTVIDDDVGGPYPPPSRDPFADRLSELGVSVSERSSESGAQLIALFGDIRAWKGRPGYSERALEEVRTAAQPDRPTVVVQFSHPRLAPSLGVAAPIVCAWGGEAVMQRAAAEWLVEHWRSD